MTDDGFNIGVLYRGTREPFAPRPAANAKSVEDLQCAFRL
jgi:2-oxoglutarate ferredoxin oxidoreductase subunit beta